MRIEEIDIADDRAFGEWYVPVHASERLDWPSDPGWQAHELREVGRSDRSTRVILAVARDGTGDAVGSAMIRLPLTDNRHLVDVDLAVHPAHRRRGAGRALVALAERVGRTDGRSKVCGRHEAQINRVDTCPSEPFAEALSYSAVLGEARRVLHAPFDAGRLTRLEQACLPFAAGYDVVTWTGRTPERFVEWRALLARTISTDAPSGDPDREEEAWDPQRVREWDDTVERMDRHVLAAGALVSGTDHLVAVSELGIPRTEPAVGYQFDTIVAREHRGHRLGTLVKIANLRALGAVSPATSRVYTWNANDNAAMIRVNEALGFEVAGIGTEWAKQLA